MDDIDWKTHPSKLLIDAIHAARAAASSAEYRVLDIADRLAAVGMDKLADECAASVSGLIDAIKRVQDAHSDSQNHDLRESERGIATMLTAIVEGCIVPPKAKKAK